MSDEKSLADLIAEAPTAETARAAAGSSDVIVMGRLRRAAPDRFALAVGPELAGLTIEGAVADVRRAVVLAAADDPIKRVVALLLRIDAEVTIAQRSTAGAAAIQLMRGFTQAARSTGANPPGARPFVLARPHAVAEVTVPARLGGSIPLAQLERDAQAIPRPPVGAFADRITLSPGEPPPKLDLPPLEPEPPRPEPPRPPITLGLDENTPPLTPPVVPPKLKLPEEDISLSELPPGLFPFPPPPTPPPPPPTPPTEGRSDAERMRDLLKALHDMPPPPPTPPPPPEAIPPFTLTPPDWLKPILEHGTPIWLGADWRFDF